MNPIRVAQLKEVKQEVNFQQINDVYICIVDAFKIKDGEITSDIEKLEVYLKKTFQPVDILIECICALLGRAIGLPIPEPIIVIDGDNIHYASVQVSSEDGGPAIPVKMTTKKNIDDIKLKLREFLPTYDCILFDEYIMNDDRSEMNVLVCGKNNFAFIDHGHALFTGQGLDLSIAENKLYNYVKPETFSVYTMQFTIHIQNAVKSFLNKMGEDVVETVFSLIEQLPFESSDLQKYKSMLLKRWGFVPGIFQELEEADKK